MPQANSHSMWAVASQGGYLWQIANFGRRYDTAHTDGVELRDSTYPMRATPLLPSPRCRRLVAEPDRLTWSSGRHLRRIRIAFVDGPCSRMCRAGEEVRWGRSLGPSWYAQRTPVSLCER